MATYALDFEKPLLELEQKLADLKRHAATGTAAGDGKGTGKIFAMRQPAAVLTSV